MELLQHFLSGAVCLGYAVAGLFFLKFWRKTRDPLFITFAIAFWILADVRVVLTMVATESELRTYLYLARLLAFLLILWAIVQKNRAAKQPRATSSPMR